jgi:DNA-binding winged helix-turn-helix (wHTH) protein/tetratricopeptide (TPR) repeat protein
MMDRGASADRQTAVNREMLQPAQLGQPDDRRQAPAAGNGARRVRFGVFEADLRNRELRKQGFRVRLQEKPFQVLEVLLEKPGELVTREQLASRLWPGVYVNFERSLNTAVNSLRRSLCDSRRSPRYVETRAGLGYVFIAPVQTLDADAARDDSAAAPSIAVLPFRNAAGTPDADALCDTLARAAIESLSAIAGLRVVARTTSSRFRDDIDVLSAGRQLNARAVITGVVGSRAGAPLVDAEIVDIRTGARLWGHRWESMPGEVPEAAAALASAVTRAFHLSPPAPHQAQQDYLKGRWFCDRLNEDDLHRADAHFEAALAQAPAFAPACAGLADTLRLFATFGIRRARDVRERARQLAAAAVAYDPRLAEAHVSLAQVRRSFEWDWAGAETEYRRALELDDASAAAHRAWAGHLAATGRIEDAVREIRHASELEPMSLAVYTDMAWILCLAGRFNDAAEASWQALALEPRFAPAQTTLAMAYQHMGMLEEALVEFRNAVACSGQHPAALASLAHANAAAGNREEAVRLLGVLREAAGSRCVSPWWFAIVHSGLGNVEAALHSLATALDERDVWMPWIAVEPRFRALHSDARFHGLLRAVGASASAEAAR